MSAVPRSWGADRMSGGREAQLTTELLSIVNSLVFDGVGPEPVECPIHTEGGRIVGLDGTPPEAARVLDARGRVVTPGLIDAHLHAYTVSMDLMENEALPMSYVAAKAARRLEAALRRGFTAVRDVAGGDIGLRAGVRIGLGTDLVGDLEDEQLLEFRIRCEVDTVTDVLRSATSVNAAILRRPDLGVIREGAAADLLVLGGNPFERTDVLWSPERLVIRSGRLVNP